MDYFDKKINELYNQPEQDVPSDLSWDFMEDDIYSRMDDRKSRRKSLWYWISGGMIAVTLIIGSIILFNAEEKNTNFATNNTKEQKSPKLNSETIIPNSSSTKAKNQIITIPEKIEEVGLSKNSNESIQSKSIVENKIPPTYNKGISQETTRKYKSETLLIDNTTSPNQEKNKNSITAYNTLSADQKNGTDFTKNISATESRISINLNEIAFSKLSDLISQREIPISKLKKIVINNNPKNKEIKQVTKYAFSLLGGTSLHSGYNIQSSDYISSLPGYSVRLGLTAEKESGWGYELGIGHSLLVEKFDLDITDTLTEYQQGVVVSHLTNSLTGNTTNVIGNAYRDSTRSRRELIYNTINLVSVDASIYRRINLFSKWSIAPSVGIQYDRILDIQGKSLDIPRTSSTNREVFPYNNNTSKINKNLVSARLGIGMDYKLTNRFSLSARASTALSFNNLYSDANRLSTTYLQGGITINL